MSRKKVQKTQNAPNFRGLLKGTAVIAVIFSAGLITGQRLVHQSTMAPVVTVGPSLATRPSAEATPPALAARDQADRADTDFSFFDRLTGHTDDGTGRAPFIQKRTQTERPTPASAPEALALALPPTPVAPPVAPMPPEPAPAAPTEVPAPIAAAAVVAPKPVATPTPPPEAAPAPKPAVAVAVAPAPAKPAPIATRPEPARSPDAMLAQASKPATSPQPVSLMAARAPARFTLQVAAHSTLERARSEIQRLRSLGLDAHMVVADVPSQGKTYRIRIGKFATQGEARAYQNTIEKRDSVASVLSPL